MKNILFVFLLIFLVINLPTSKAQVVDTIPTLVSDTLNVISDTLITIDPDTTVKKKFSIRGFLKSGYPDPNKAALLSLIVPGAGQFYNKKYWKIPIVYGGIGAALYFAIDDEKEYRYFRDNYRYRVDLDDSTVADSALVRLTDANIKTIRNRFDKRRQQLYALTLGVWLLQGMDAYVDAHLATFDLDEDLTLRIKPSIKGSYLGQSAGLSIALQIRTTNTIPKDVWNNSD